MQGRRNCMQNDRQSREKVTENEYFQLYYRIRSSSGYYDTVTSVL